MTNQAKEELKTLKDIEFMKDWEEHVVNHIEPNLRPILTPHQCWENRLRQEAIKWVKALEEKRENLNSEIYLSYQINWIMHFFNLTEEDLK